MCDVVVLWLVYSWVNVELSNRLLWLGESSFVLNGLCGGSNNGYDIRTCRAGLSVASLSSCK